MQVVCYNKCSIFYKEGELIIMHCTLSTLMGKNRFSIQDVHEKTGLSRTTISNLYNDKVTRIDYETADKLCQLFNCSLNDLFCIEEELL